MIGYTLLGLTKVVYYRISSLSFSPLFFHIWLYNIHHGNTYNIHRAYKRGFFSLFASSLFVLLSSRLSSVLSFLSLSLPFYSPLTSSKEPPARPPTTIEPRYPPRTKPITASRKMGRERGNRCTMVVEERHFL